MHHTSNGRVGLAILVCGISETSISADVEMECSHVAKLRTFRWTGHADLPDVHFSVRSETNRKTFQHGQCETDTVESTDTTLFALITNLSSTGLSILRLVHNGIGGEIHALAERGLVQKKASGSF